MSTAEQILKLSYEGSVKRVWQCPWNENSLLFEFTDDYSVFDWGKMPDTIKYKGKALAIFGTYFFEKLADKNLWSKFMDRPELGVFDNNFLDKLASGKAMKELAKRGMESHFIKLVHKDGKKIDLQEAASSNEPIYMEVHKAEVLRPEPSIVLGQNVFSYPQADMQQTRLIPLEVVFRFGMPEGSSLKARLKNDPDYAFTLGLSSVPIAGKWFERPVLEFYTKLEPKDRLLSVQEALLISGLQPFQMQELCDRAFLAALALYADFSQQGIELWDGKFEFILSDGQIVLADSIGPDELRLLYKGTHLSKEMIRRVYRGSEWENSLKTSQKLARDRATLDWKEICKNELKSEPVKFSPDVKFVIDRLYPVLVNKVCEKDLFTVLGRTGKATAENAKPSEKDSSAPPLLSMDEFITLAHKTGLAEDPSSYRGILDTRNNESDAVTTAAMPGGN